jgi:hypothetical protein
MTQRVHTAADALREHALALAEAFGVPLIEAREMGLNDGVAVAGTFVVTSPITDEVSYAKALHEIGHCVAPAGNVSGGPGDIKMKLVAEEAAWDWAQAMAEQFGVWTPAMESTRRGAFGTYEAELKRRLDAIDERRGHPSESVSAFADRIAPGLEPPTPPRPKLFHTCETVADFLKRRR